MRNRKNLLALTALLTITLIPSVSLAFKDPSNGTIDIVQSWLQHWLLPTPGLSWFWAITFPLTLVGLIWATSGTKTFFSYVGGWVVAGMFFAFTFGILLFIPMFFWNYFDIWWLWKVILFGVICWLIGFLIKQIGVNPLGPIEALFGWVRAIPAKAKANPNMSFMIAGAFFVAVLICGKEATMITKQWGLVPGLIPGISAAFGLVILFYRVILGNKVVVAKVRPVRATTGTQAATRPKGSWLCQELKPAVNAAGEHIPLRDGQGNAILVNGGPQMKMEACGNWNTAEASNCLGCGRPKS